MKWYTTGTGLAAILALSTCVQPPTRTQQPRPVFPTTSMVIKPAPVKTLLTRPLQGVSFADLVVSDQAIIAQHGKSMLAQDQQLLDEYRPGHSFWKHVFTIPDRHIAFGSREDGRLVAVFSNTGEWAQSGEWHDASAQRALDNKRFSGTRTRQREQVATALEARVGPVVHNATRGDFFVPNAERYGSFAEEWSAMYERFGVPARIGLSQAIVESGFNGVVRSEANAQGLCQWLRSNWSRMDSHAPTVIEVNNQSTQAPYCAAYLSVLATKYGSFLPALSEHHAGGTNVGRALLNGEWRGAQDVAEQYLEGSDFLLAIRELSSRRYSDVTRTYGPRSALYAEMVFGNAENVDWVLEHIDQERVYAMQATRNIPLDEIVQKTGLSVDEVKRFNPALVRQVPQNANVYLPFAVKEFGRDVSFWHRPAPPEYSAVLKEFVQINEPWQRWHDPSFMPVLDSFQQRFFATNTPEGDVMGAVLGYVRNESVREARAEILSEYETNPRIKELVAQGVRALYSSGVSGAVARDN